MLNSAYLYQQIPVEIRPFFKIEMADIPSQYANLLDNIAQAIRAIIPFVLLNKTVNVVVGTQPFELQLQHATLSVRLFPPTLHMAIENFAFLDLNHMIGLPDALQRACVLEELTHVLMNVKDEHIVKLMVAEMLPDVRYVNGKYHAL